MTVLARKFGVRLLEPIEDAVQVALEAALTCWATQGLPARPGAWLYRVAHNELMGQLRKEKGRARILESSTHDFPADEDPPPDTFFDHEIRDGMLRMLFVCCDEAIPNESRIVLALKTLCGFSTSEIALRLFTTEANVHKRLSRARERLREVSPDLDTPSLESLEPRLSSVHEILYLLFNEGYLSAHAEFAIRRELCDEAIRLVTLLAEHPIGSRPETFALLALMHFHAARLAGRVAAGGELLLLQEQDRTVWDRESMQTGMQWLARSASGEVFTRFHAEAAIAAEHCLAASFSETRWSEIVDLYCILERIAPSPLHTLNKAVAVAEAQGHQSGLEVLLSVVPPPWLEDSYLWHAAASDLYRRCGNHERALHHGGLAVASAPTDALRALLMHRLALSTDTLECVEGTLLNCCISARRKQGLR
ncbi:MAG: polymerase sigma-70 factor [Steroidobacteraceae bacterium]|nr:polymerase sigma-70 factor [Steroidobacteraceae bacterium]